MSDLVERLRDLAEDVPDYADATLIQDAAAEIERLRAAFVDDDGPWSLAAVKAERDALRASVARLRRLLATWLRAADTGVWRDRMELSIAAHPVADDTRAALSAAPEPGR